MLKQCHTKKNYINIIDISMHIITINIMINLKQNVKNIFIL